MQKIIVYLCRNKKIIVSILLCLSVVGLLALGMNPEKGSVVIETSGKTDQTVGEMIDGTIVEQPIKINNEESNEIRLLAATYGKVLKNGSLRADLIERNSGSIVATKVWRASDIKDNTFIDLPIDVGAGNYTLKIRSEDFTVGDAPTLFQGEIREEAYVFHGEKQNAPVSFSISTMKKVYNVNGIFALIVLLLLSGGYYLSQYGKLKLRQPGKYVFVLVFIIVGGILLTSYQTTTEWKPQTLYRLCTYQPQAHKVTDLVITNLNDRTEFNYDYRNDGSIKTIYKSIHLNDLNDDVFLMTLYMEPDSRKQQYDFSLYYNLNGSYEDLQKVSKIFYGQKEMHIVLDEQMPIEEIRLDAGYREDLVALDKTIDFFKLDRVVINDSGYIASLQQKAKLGFVLNSLLLLLISVAFAAWKRIKKEKKDIVGNCDPIKSFVIFGVVFGILFTFVLPIYQAPDEGHHVRMIGQELGYSSFEEEMSTATMEMDVERIAHLSGEKVDRAAYFSGIDNFFENDIPRDAFQLSINILRHLPQDIGIELGLLLNLPAYWIFILGRLTALAIYLLLGAFAIKLIPIKKTLLMIIMLCPMMMQQAASLSYDSFLMGLCMLYIADVLYLKFEKATVGWKDLLVIGIMLMGISIIKIPYALLALLVLIIPTDKVKLPLFRVPNVMHYRKSIMMAGFAITLLVIWLLSQIRYGKLLYAFFLSPAHSVKLISNTLYVNWEFYAKSMAGNFGWLDTPVEGWFVWFMALFLLFGALTYENEGPLECCRKQRWLLWDKIVLHGSFGGIALLIIISMVAWSFKINYIEMGESINEIIQQISLISIIEGVQGRYFLPTILLPLIPMDGILSGCRQDVRLIRSAAIVLIICYTMIVLLNRYWIISPMS